MKSTQCPLCGNREIASGTDGGFLLRSWAQAQGARARWLQSWAKQPGSGSPAPSFSLQDSRFHVLRMEFGGAAVPTQPSPSRSSPPRSLSNTENHDKWMLGGKGWPSCLLPPHISPGPPSWLCPPLTPQDIGEAVRGWMGALPALLESALAWSLELEINLYLRAFFICLLVWGCT